MVHPPIKRALVTRLPNKKRNEKKKTYTNSKKFIRSITGKGATWEEKLTRKEESIQ